MADTADTDAGAPAGTFGNPAGGADPSRCAWCAGGDGEIEELRLRIPDQIALNRFWVRLPVHPRHERPLRRFAARFRRDGRRFVVSMIALIVVAFAFFLVLHAVEGSSAVRDRWADAFVGPWMAALGVVLLLFPFATPLTTALIGIRHTVVLVRGAG
ncbi:MAG: hypothetical protein ACOC83_05275, partial [Gemmatimonadota bacterium]